MPGFRYKNRSKTYSGWPGGEFCCQRWNRCRNCVLWVPLLCCEFGLQGRTDWVNRVCLVGFLCCEERVHRVEMLTVVVGFPDYVVKSCSCQFFSTDMVFSWLKQQTKAINSVYRRTCCYPWRLPRIASTFYAWNWKEITSPLNHPPNILALTRLTAHSITRLYHVLIKFTCH